MAEYDLVVRGGTVVDGTGVPRFKADVAVKDGRIAQISGRIPSSGAKEIDASGCIVGTGAIDLHTHYDAQLNWDPYASLSGWFGVTSLTIGECGFGFAPTRPADRDLNMRMMNRIEAIPLESMRQGLRWDWETFPEYMDSLERQGLGLNVGPMFPFSPMRGYVMGMMEARERTSATEAELNQMRQLFDEAMKAGAFGFSLDKNMEDRPEDGSFLPSHVASREEFVALAEVMSGYGVGHMGLTMGYGLNADEQREILGTMTGMMRASGRTLSALVMDPAGTGELAKWKEESWGEGLPLVLQDLCTPPVVGFQFKLSEFNLYDFMPNWVQPFIGTPEERAEKLRDADNRELMRQDVVDWPHHRTNWDRLRVLETVHARNGQYEGMTVSEIAKVVGKTPLDAFLDLALDEGLETEFALPLVVTEEEHKGLEQRLLDPNTHISVSDGGAHTRFSTTSVWPVFWLYYWIRDREIMSLEQAHYKMSALPAWVADFKDRGTLRVGSWADMIIYDMDKLGLLYENPVYANDFPGGEKRLIQKPTGLRYTIVNGTVTFEGNDCTGALPGKLLRSYDMVG